MNHGPGPQRAVQATPPRSELEADGFFDDPYPVYARLRALPGPYFLHHTMAVASGGVQLFSRHAEALQLFRETTAISKEVRRVRPAGAGSPFDLHLLHRDGADHLRLRRLVAEHFSAAAMQRLQATLDDVATGLIAELHGHTQFDAVTHLAEPMPLALIARLIGVPQEVMPRVRQWSLVLADGFDSLLSSPARMQAQQHTLAAFMDLGRELADAGRAPADSLLGHLLQQCGRQALDGDEVLAMLAFLLFAGHETTISLIGNALYTLLRHPGTWQRLRDQPHLLPGAVEEVLRFESPEQRTSFRQVLQPLQVGSVTLEPGSQVGVIIGSANRDEAVFERPEVFDITRSPNPHLAFGFGLHHCLGKSLARQQATTLLGHLLREMPQLALPHSPGAGERPVWRRNSFFRGLQTLPLVRRG